jgi:hypothetical protein
MTHLYVNSNPEGFDSNCLVCGGKDRDTIHHQAEEENDYVAYLYFTHPVSGEPVLHIGDSDTPGAFKVYRRRL